MASSTGSIEHTTEATTERTTVDADLVVGRYLAVWREPDAERRRAAVAELWAEEGVEFVEGTRFSGHEQLTARVAEAHQAFVGSGTYEVTCPGDVSEHGDIVMFTIQLVARAGTEPGEVAWAARVLLVLDEEGRIRQDYQLTVKPLAV